VYCQQTVLNETVNSVTWFGLAYNICCRPTERHVLCHRKLYESIGKYKYIALFYAWCQLSYFTSTFVSYGIVQCEKAVVHVGPTMSHRVTICYSHFQNSSIEDRGQTDRITTPTRAVLRSWPGRTAHRTSRHASAQLIDVTIKSVTVTYYHDRQVSYSSFS